MKSRATNARGRLTGQSSEAAVSRRRAIVQRLLSAKEGAQPRDGSNGCSQSDAGAGFAAEVLARTHHRSWECRLWGRARIALVQSYSCKRESDAPTTV